MRIFKTKLFARFAKNERENIDDKELRTLRGIANAWLAADVEHIESEIASGRLQEVWCDK